VKQLENKSSAFEEILFNRIEKRKDD